MTEFIIVAIVVFLFVAAVKKKERQNKYYTPPKKVYPKVTTTIAESTHHYNKNDSVIDVTGKSYQLDSSISKPTLEKVAQGVPHWQHHYVYSYSEITAATKEQQKFYSFLKGAFLNGVYIDLEGNTNYAFILFFDLLDEFLRYKDLIKIKNQLAMLGLCYPKTANYAIPELIKRLESLGDQATIQELQNGRKAYYENQYNDYENYRLGSKFKSKLKLSPTDVALLNKVWQPLNNFGSIDYCCIQIIRLYLKTIEGLIEVYKKESTTLDEQFVVIGDLIARKHYNYRTNSSNYKHILNLSKDEIYSAIFKICENTVRDAYQHKRKLATEFYGANTVIPNEFQNRVGYKVEILHKSLKSTIAPPDGVTEIELNALSTGRWKTMFEKLTNEYNGDSKLFQERIELLALQNRKNPAIEHIYFEASKFIAKSDKQAALLFYVHYIDTDLRSAKIDNKQLTKTVQKSLFATPEQLQAFEKIVNDLIATRDVKKALEAVAMFYVPKRKKIKLNKDAISEAHEKHAGTVELLNEYLKDETEEQREVVALEKQSHEDDTQVELKTNDIAVVQRNSKLTEVQQALLDYFQKNGLSLTVEELDSFAKVRGVFRNQLIESINETCYETLDDILIEEEEDAYTINHDYFQQILAL